MKLLSFPLISSFPQKQHTHPSPFHIPSQSVALHSQGYDKDFCDKVQKLSLLSLNQAVELGNPSVNDTSATSAHVILLKEFYSLIENPDYDILLNGQSIKQSPKSLTCNSDSNSLVLSKKY